MVVDGRYPATGGAEMQARLLSAALAQLGHRVQVLAPRLDRRHPRRERIDGIPVRRLSYPRIRILGAILLNLRFAAFLIGHRHRFDVVHIHMMHNLAGAAGWVGRRLRPRTLVKVSGYAEFHEGILDPRHRHHPIHRILVAGTMRLDAFQCISHYTHAVMQDAGYPADKLHLLPNAVDCARFSQCERPHTTPDLRVAFAGRHVPVKALDVLLHAWSQTRRPQGARLVLAGDGPQRQRLMQMAEALGIADTVEFPGTVEDVPRLFADACLYVQPSRQEGLPNAVLEAMAAGLPVIATRISGHEDVIHDGKTGLLVAPDDANALAAAIERLLSDPGLRDRIGRGARRHVRQHYSIPAVTTRLLHAYRPGAEIGASAAPSADRTAS